MCCRFFPSRFCFADDFTRRHLISHKGSPSLFRPVFITFFFFCFGRNKNKQTRAQVELKQKNGAVATAAYRRTGCVTDWPTATSNSIHFHVRLSFHNFPNGFIIIRLGQNKKKTKQQKRKKNWANGRHDRWWPTAINALHLPRSINSDARHDFARKNKNK